MKSEMMNLDDTSFVEAVEKDSSPILVDFWAEWCMPCRILSPIVEELASEYQGKVRFAKMNVDHCREVPFKFNIRSIPTLILFKDGKKVNQLIGTQPKEKIKMMLNSVLEQ